jgi:phosphoglycerate dehydrogenase-like enzyme
MGAREFQAMGDDGVFVNTSRGACVDEEALIAELEKGRLLALLDVTLPEPAAADSTLRRLPNVHLFSHIGGPPDFRLGRHAVDNIEVYINGGRPDWVVTSDMLDLMA